MEFLRFYQGKATTKPMEEGIPGKTISELRMMDDDEFFRTRNNYMQWLFPLPKRSRDMQDAVYGLLTKEEAFEMQKEVQEGGEVNRHVKGMLERVLTYWGIS